MTAKSHTGGGDPELESLRSQLALVKIAERDAVERAEKENEKQRTREELERRGIKPCA